MRYRKRKCKPGRQIGARVGCAAADPGVSTGGGSGGTAPFRAPGYRAANPRPEIEPGRRAGLTKRMPPQCAYRHPLVAEKAASKGACINPGVNIQVPQPNGP